MILLGLLGSGMGDCGVDERVVSQIVVVSR